MMYFRVIKFFIFLSFLFAFTVANTNNISSGNVESIISYNVEDALGYKRYNKPQLLFGGGLSSSDYYWFAKMLIPEPITSNWNQYIAGKWGQKVTGYYYGANLLLWESVEKDETVVLAPSYQMLFYNPTNTKIELVNGRLVYNTQFEETIHFQLGINASRVMSRSNNLATFRNEAVLNHIFGSVDYFVFKKIALSIDFDYKEPKIGFSVFSPIGSVNFMYGLGQDEQTFRFGINHVYFYPDDR